LSSFLDFFGELFFYAKVFSTEHVPPVSGQVRGPGDIGSGQLLVEHGFAISLWIQVQYVYQY
jgi:hypothetical protein